MRKNDLKEDIQYEIKDMPLQYQKIILDIIRLMKASYSSIRKSHDILELKGCGKELWNQTDTQDYICCLRNEWD